MSSAQVRPTSPTPSAGPIRESASFTAHLKAIERKLPPRSHYDNFIGGQWVAPANGAYFDNVSPTTGQVICQIARSHAEGTRHQDWSRVDQLLPRLSRACGVWRLQEIRHRPRDAQDDAGPLPADQECSGEL